MTALVELSLDSSDLDRMDDQSGALLSVVDEIAALHAGLEESGAALESAGSAGELAAAGPHRRSASPETPATS